MLREDDRAHWPTSETWRDSRLKNVEHWEFVLTTRGRQNPDKCWSRSARLFSCPCAENPVGHILTTTDTRYMRHETFSKPQERTNVSWTENQREPTHCPLPPFALTVCEVKKTIIVLSQPKDNFGRVTSFNLHHWEKKRTKSTCQCAVT